MANLGPVAAGLSSLGGGGLLRDLQNQQLTPVAPVPEAQPGTALRQTVQEPLQKQLDQGVGQTFLNSSQSGFLAQLENVLQGSNFSPEEAASLINAIIEKPTSKTGTAAKAAARPTTAARSVGRAAAPAQAAPNRGISPGVLRAAALGRQITGGAIGQVPTGNIYAPRTPGGAYAAPTSFIPPATQSQTGINPFLNFLANLAGLLGYSR